MDKKLQEKFSDIFKYNSWGSDESVSGPGSTLTATRNIQRELPILINHLGVKTILDAPCGDFNWMNSIDLAGVQYTGVDIVSDIVNRNSQRYKSSNVKFELADITDANLSSFDLILCRDCFFHLSNANIKKALNNFKRSGSKYLLTTTYTWLGLQNNVDIDDGGWRRINLWQSPFNLPMPEFFIVEGNQESGGAQADRILGLWHLGRIGPF